MTLLIRTKRSRQWWILRPARRSVTCCTAVEVLVELLSHVLSGHSKVPHQGASCVALVHLEEGKCWPFPAPTYLYLQVDKGNSAQLAEVSSNILNQSEWYNWHGMDTNQAFVTHEFLATRARQKGPPAPALSLPLRPCQPISKC